MKTFTTHSFSLKKCKSELKAFKTLLNSKTDLSERDDILPFFKKSPHISSFISTYISEINSIDKIATEYNLFGDFTCDLVIGDSSKKVYIFIEFEDAKKNSLFTKKGSKSTPEWSYRLEHGFSQIVDWFWKLNDMEKTNEYNTRFGDSIASIHGILIVGRNQSLEDREKHRLKWRQENTVVKSRKIIVLTFDQLYEDLSFRMSTYSKMVK